LKLAERFSSDADVDDIVGDCIEQLVSDCQRAIKGSLQACSDR